MFEAASLSFFLLQYERYIPSQVCQTPRVLVNGGTDSSVTKQPTSWDLKKNFLQRKVPLATDHLPELFS